MKTIAISSWLAYAPFRLARAALRDLNVQIEDRASDRVEGLKEGKYAAALLSTYALAEALDWLGTGYGVGGAYVEPVGYGSDRIIVRPAINSIADLYRSKIGLCRHGLEINLFEHLFASEGLPGKADYVFLPDRTTYVKAFCDSTVDAVMAPQPDRSRILESNSDAVVYTGDQQLPRFGLYAVLIFRQAEWDKKSLEAVHKTVWSKAQEITLMDDEQINESLPSSFIGIPSPKEELESTLRWLSPGASNNYLRGMGENSFPSHLRQVNLFRASRFNDSIISEQRLNDLLN